jgi:hypothetical protein
MTFHRPLVLAIVVSLAACGVSPTLSPADQSSDAAIPVLLPTELNSTSVLAKAPMVDTARVAGVSGYVAILGLLHQTAPCFGLTSAASRQGSRVVVRLVAQQVQGTCATFAAGAFDYDVAVKGLAPGTYDVEVLHRVVFNDGRVAEASVGARRVGVR